MRRPKTQRVARTRASNAEGEFTWTEAGFWGFLRSGLRQMSVRWPPITSAEHAARRPYTGSNKRQKWEYQCGACGEWFKRKEVQVDHIVPCGSLKCWEDLQPFCERLFCELGGLRVVCRPCHEDITKGAAT